ncbi:MAG TPA: hypothetical protein VFE53_18005 [Mucilaginibacter sp.]|jgi:hypothetical protein|nr:hypothetical protein [Mucilaginibacter sp.]
MNTIPFPDQYVKFNFYRILTRQELEKIKIGHIPVDMDDRWIVYFEDPWIYFHRSWTGIGIYKARVIEEGDIYAIDEFLMNGDSTQYRSKVADEQLLFESALKVFLGIRLRIMGVIV